VVVFTLICHRFVALNPDIFRGKVVLELGAGCGLAGMLASQIAETVVLTDGNLHVLELLDKNARTQRQKGLSGNVYAMELLWGDEASLEKVSLGFDFKHLVISAEGKLESAPAE